MHAGFSHFSAELLQGKEGIFWSERVGDTHTWQCGFGEKKSAEFSVGPFPIFTVTDFLGENFFGYHFEQNYCSSDFNLEEMKLFLPEVSRTDFELSDDSEQHDHFIENINSVKKLAESGELWVLNLAENFRGLPASGVGCLSDFQSANADHRHPKIESVKSLNSLEKWLSLFSQFLTAEKDHIGGFVWTDELKCVSFSPELFIRQSASKIKMRPIKGTGTRKYLQNSEKEISELAMVTDLYRNDLGKFADSVRVQTERRVVGTDDFAHAEAEIEAKLESFPLSGIKDPSRLARSSTGLFTAENFQSLLPVGSTSGCPKHRVCQYIAALENFDRQFYTGTLGVQNSPSAGSGQDAENFLANVLIRTFFIAADGSWNFPVGAGITHLSGPDSEWNELQEKFDRTLNFLD